MKDRFVKLVVCVCLVGSYFFLPKYGFTAFDTATTPAELSAGFTTTPCELSLGILPHFLYPFSHANIFHLAANILCLWMLRCPMHLVATYLIAVLCSFLPSFSIYDSIAQGGFPALSEPTYGFSGILFAMVGVSWGKIHRFRSMILRNKWYLIIPAFLPHVNFLIHIYCLLLGYLYGHYSQRVIAGHNPPSSCDRKSANS